MSDIVVGLTSYLSPAAVERIGFYTVAFVSAVMALRLIIPILIVRRLRRLFIKTLSSAVSVAYTVTVFPIHLATDFFGLSEAGGQIAKRHARSRRG